MIKWTSPSAFSKMATLWFLFQLAKDLLHPTSEEEKRSHKKKRLVQSPNSYFMDVKCPGCYKITTVFSHAQTVVLCVGCSTVLCQPTGGKARLTEGTILHTAFHTVSRMEKYCWT
uniref:40S ribosomal protein S27 n=1 Tax=Oncorhynchus tshawytscha TaxID=74940 RepID=A0AAZ3NZM9_ONCTS